MKKFINIQYRLIHKKIEIAADRKIRSVESWKPTSPNSRSGNLFYRRDTPVNKIKKLPGPVLGKGRIYDDGELRARYLAGFSFAYARMKYDDLWIDNKKNYIRIDGEGFRWICMSVCVLRSRPLFWTLFESFHVCVEKSMVRFGEKISVYL